MAENLAMQLYKNVYRALQALESISKESRKYADQYDKIIDFFKLLKTVENDPEKLKKVLESLRSSVVVLERAVENSLEPSISLYINDLRHSLSELKDMVKNIKLEDQLELNFDDVPLDKLKETD